MKELQAKAKVTQTMTRDGLVVENQADGTVENVSCREAEQDYSLKSGAIITMPQCKRGCLWAMTYRQADTPLPSKSERSERRRQ